MTTLTPEISVYIEDIIRDHINGIACLELISGDFPFNLHPIIPGKIGKVLHINVNDISDATDEGVNWQAESYVHWEAEIGAYLLYCTWWIL